MDGSISLEYAVVERERRFLLATLPDGVGSTMQIVDRYLTGTRLRLREVHDAGTLVSEIDDRDQPSGLVPGWLDALEDLSEDERWPGARLAQ